MAKVILIPTVLYEGVTAPLPQYIGEALHACTHFFTENERTVRRYIKSIIKDFDIDSRAWHNIKEVTPQVEQQFLEAIKSGATIGILSEAGCPGVADPGQHLVALAQKKGVLVQPLVGPNAILLALMASGMNGQHFRFVGYLPIDAAERSRTIKLLESESAQKSCTQIFIETPYRNNQLLETLLKTCNPQTRICIGVDITAPTESIITKTVVDWKKQLPQLHKRPAVFLLQAG